MKGLYTILIALLICIYAVSAQHYDTSNEVDYVNNNEEASLIETDLEVEDNMEVDMEDEMEVDNEDEVEVDNEDENEEEVDVDDEDVESSFIDSKLVVANTTFVPNNSTNTTVTVPIGPNPLDPCGCYNGAVCHKDSHVCVCPPEWTGLYCEKRSDIAVVRSQELNSLTNLTNIISDVATKLQHIEATAGNPQTIQNLIAESARIEVSKLHLTNSEREFHKALSRNDLYSAKSQLNLIKHLNYDRFIALERELRVQEERIANQFNNYKPTPKQMEVPVMQEDKYNEIEVGPAKNLKLSTFKAAEELNTKALDQRRQFNLDFGDAV